MAVNNSALANDMYQKMIQGSLAGTFAKPLSTAISNGIISTFLSLNSVVTSDIGTQGKGFGTGKITGIIESSFDSMLNAKFKSVGIKGVMIPALSRAISYSVVSHFKKQGISNTQHSSIGIGSAKGSIKGLTPQAFTSKILSEGKSKGLHGKDFKNIASAVSECFCKYFQASALINATITGAVIPPPPTGPLPGKGSGKGKVS